MSSGAPLRRVPEVNLLVHQKRPVESRGLRRYVEVALMAVVVVIWAGVGVLIAVLFGWNPGLGP